MAEYTATGGEWDCGRITDQCWIVRHSLVKGKCGGYHYYIQPDDCWTMDENTTYDHARLQMFNWLPGEKRSYMKLNEYRLIHYASKGWVPWATQRKLQ